jgi:uncharacterized protein
MLDSLKGTFRRLIAAQQTQTYRYLYDKFTLEDRLIGLIGPRGVGKTTLLLQIIKNRFTDLQGVFYFSADHIYFNSHHLYQFIEDLYRNEEITTFFIDEIHKYPNWEQELKNLYDGFPKIKIVFSGSSSLDLVKGSYDLSRRARLHTLEGLSFREFLNFKTHRSLDAIHFEALLENPLGFNSILPDIPQLKNHFKAYLQGGYYPFFLEGESTYFERILRVVDKTIYEDISGFYKLKTQNLPIFKRILNYLSTIEPGTFSHHNLAKNLAIDDKTATHYLSILESTGLIRTIHPYAKGNQILRKPEKVFLNNTTLSSAINSALGESQSIGLMRELFFLQSTHNANIQVFYSKIGDYRTKEYAFEIGGKNKNNTQLKESDIPSFLIKDEIIFATKTEIPLYLFGFLY